MRVQLTELVKWWVRWWMRRRFGGPMVHPGHGFMVFAPSPVRWWWPWAWRDAHKVERMLLETPRQPGSVVWLPKGWTP